MPFVSAFIDHVLGFALLAAGLGYGLLKALEHFGVLRSPSAWRTEAEALDREVKRLAGKILALENELSRLRAENQELKARPDQRALYQLMERHDRREQENHEATLKALERIAGGPPIGGR